MKPDNENYKNMDDIKCVWMSSKVVAYRLCNRNFDCENCEFDTALRNSALQKSARAEFQLPFQDLIDKLKNPEKTHGSHIYFLRNSLTLKTLLDNYYYIGINPSALMILDGVTSTKLRSENRPVKKDDTFFRLVGDWGTYDVKSPLNFKFLGKINGDKEDYMTGKWFGFIEADKEEVKAAYVEEKKYKEFLKNLAPILEESIQRQSKAGVTMADGGYRVKHLTEVMGKSKYKEILKKLFTM